MLSSKDLTRGLTTAWIGRSIHTFDTIDSTNARARSLAVAGAESGTVVFAEHQTAGRGRLGRTWNAEAGANLLFSVILRPDISKERVPLLTFYAAVAVAEGVDRVAESHVETKWPNDLLLGGRKFCGILIESSIARGNCDHVVVGVGMNVNQRQFPDDLRSSATSLSLALDTTFDRVQILQSVLRSLERWHDHMQANGFHTLLAAWKSRCRMFGVPVRITASDGEHRGTALSLADDGGLVVQFADAIRVIYAGDVTFNT